MDLGSNQWELQFAIPTAFTFQGSNRLQTGYVTDLPTEYNFLNAEDFMVIANGSDQYEFSIINGAVYIELIGNAFTSGITGSATIPLPPGGESIYTTNTNILDDLCYAYKYDRRNRLVEKKIPGKGWEYIIYDQLDRPVLTQDAQQRLAKEWLFTKYDVYGRVIYTGIFTNADTETDDKIRRDNLQATFDNPALTAGAMYEDKLASGLSNLNIEYTNDNFPGSTENLVVHTVNYYDDYNFNTDGLVVPTQVVLNTTTPVTTETKGLVTGSKVRVLSGSDNWITTLTAYDAKARPIYVASKNQYLVTTYIVKTELDFMGKVLLTESSHAKDSNPAIITLDAFTYDHAARLKSQEQTITVNGQSEDTELIVENSYDDIGQLVEKGVGHLASNTTTRLQRVNYNYNIRGWLSGINNESGNNASITLGTNDLFGFQINYNNPNSGTGLYNGNISQTLWKTTSVNTSGNPISTNYTYGYDALNRIKSATGTNANYDVTGVNYDLNGNIQSLARQGQDEISLAMGTIDNLSYYYHGNQLHSVTDTGNTTGFNDGNASDSDYNTTDNDYAYDTNGNLISDANKGIGSITYNHLNLPSRVTIASNKYLEYIYDATGIKLEKKVKDGNGGSSVITTLYAGNYVYENGSLKFFNHPEGYVDAANGYKYVYQYKDHLGNVRLSYMDSDGNGSINASTEILEENNYYPFGLRHKGYNNVVTSTNPAQNYTYNGKEEQEELGLSLLDYGNRNYDAGLGRFITIDKFSQKYLDKSPYHYGANNPILYADKKGDSIIVSTRARLYNGVDGHPTDRVEVTQDLGGTALERGTASWNYNETSKEIDATFYIEQQFSPVIAPGADNKFTRKNPGIGVEIEAHEDGHRDQFSEAILDSNDFSVTLQTHDGEKSFSGGVQSILNDIYKSYETNLTKALEDLKTDNPFNLSIEDVREEQKTILNNNMNSAIDQLEGIISSRVINSNNNDPGHSDANNRAVRDYLGGRARYINGRRAIWFWDGN